MRRNYLSNYILKQFNIKKFQTMIKAFLNLVESFQLIVDSEEYQIRFTSTDEIRVGGTRKPTNSIVETFMHNKYDTIAKKEQLLLKYKVAFNSLNDIERKVFKATFIDNITTSDICEELVLYPNKLSEIKKSAIVKFSLRLGFDHFINSF